MLADASTHLYGLPYTVPSCNRGSPGNTGPYSVLTDPGCGIGPGDLNFWQTQLWSHVWLFWGLDSSLLGDSGVDLAAEEQLMEAKEEAGEELRRSGEERCGNGTEFQEF